jgi:hypothetical protein
MHPRRRQDKIKTSCRDSSSTPQPHIYPLSVAITMNPAFPGDGEKGDVQSTANILGSRVLRRRLLNVHGLWLSVIPFYPGLALHITCRERRPMSPPVPRGKRSGRGRYVEDILAEGGSSPAVVVDRIRRMTVEEVAADSSCCSCPAEEGDNSPFDPSNQMLTCRDDRGSGNVFR